MLLLSSDHLNSLSLLRDMLPSSLSSWSLHQNSIKLTAINSFTTHTHTHTHTYRVSQEECARLREGVPYVKVYRYNPKTPMSKVKRLRR